MSQRQVQNNQKSFYCFENWTGIDHDGKNPPEVTNFIVSPMGQFDHQYLMMSVLFYEHKIISKNLTIKISFVQYIYTALVSQ